MKIRAPAAATPGDEASSRADDEIGPCRMPLSIQLPLHSSGRSKGKQVGTGGGERITAPLAQWLWCITSMT